MSDDASEVAGAMVHAAFSVVFESFNKLVYKAGSPAAKFLGEEAKRRLEAVLGSAHKKLTERGVEKPRQLPDKVIAPIINNCVLEEDDDMKERWANLIATALDAASGQEIPPSFPRILADLSPEEASILDKLYGNHIEGRNPDAVYPNVAYPVNVNFKFDRGNDFAMRVNHLEALGLLKVDYAMTADKRTFPSSLVFTKLGYAFVCAVWTPGKTPEPIRDGYAPNVVDTLGVRLGT